MQQCGEDPAPDWKRWRSAVSIPYHAFVTWGEAQEMADNKTKPTEASVAGFINAIAEPQRRTDAKTVIRLMQRATGKKPKLWGSSIVGFGSCHYVYESGREGDMPIIAFAPRKAALVLYNLIGASGADTLLARLGKHSTGKGCLYIKKLADVDEGVLGQLIANAANKRRRNAL
jgi:hypothetical protein